MTEEWLPNHEMECGPGRTTSTTSSRRILPEFGPLRMIEILPAHVREWINKLKNEGVGPSAIQYCMVVLSAIFTTALNDR